MSGTLVREGNDARARRADAPASQMWVPAAEWSLAYSVTLQPTSTPAATQVFEMSVDSVTITSAAPTITTQPVSRNVTTGASAAFSVVANSVAPLGYQWRRNGANIPGATSSTYSIASVQLSDAANYDLVVTNAAGSATSIQAALTVTPGATARLVNLSVRTAMTEGQTLIVGAVIDGGTRNILVRAAGPALADLGVAGAMADPRLEVFSGQTPVFSNDDWPAPLASSFTSVGAFAFPAGSKDAAILQSLFGAFSIQCRGTGSGVVLVEAYDTATASSTRLVNVSARNRVGSSDDILIAGFNISGTGAKQLLIRAIGPKLAAFGVSGALVDPKLEVFDSAGVKLTENDNWPPSLASTIAAVGAFELDAGSKDAALLITLASGSYTVQIQGADSGTGEALVEIYDVP